ncbi:MAG: ribosome small subunit-dependent GTPase A [Bacteroidetes bacterium]|nr:MAG: ribosome small subunit-dependent GTPase A [Bacteroidota bacterium]REK03540.1 MAG: ribosome small subunit-dependent GTPase A [Bacteroidota bacterium]REK34843.1 MAG: ribosome small subunit-dependent GTPase A [Bacteroidota bacterium]REK51214.1 MAG: ribosome small subunit-dependent GTPase A [Bacteroidota bacterium]
MEGVVIKSTGLQYLVRTDENETVLCRIRGNLRLKGFEATNPVTVGDRVLLDIRKGEDQGLITDLLPRKNYIIRKSVKLSRQVQILAANIDRAFVVATPVLPKTSLGFIDRFLATAEAYNISAGIIWNKADIYDDDVWTYIEQTRELYESIGYKVYCVSALSGFGMDGLREGLKGNVNLFSGHSGVGKSSLINKLLPELDLKTAELSSQHLKGMHTTTFAEMHLLPEGGYIIDTPGIREFGTIDFDTYEVSHFFPEIFKVSEDCYFNNCIHLNEKDCAVKRAVEDGKISETRFDSYLSILTKQDVFK